MAKPIVLIPHLYRLADAINFRKDYSPPSSPPSRPFQRLLQSGDAGVDSGSTVVEAALQIREPPVPAVVMSIEAAIEARHLVKEQLEVRLHRTSRPLESSK